jgi:hypothetical protein
MTFAIINLLSNVFMTSFAFVGMATVINKTGKFCKIINEAKKDSFKNGFDMIMLDTVEEMNRCVESISIITSNSHKMIFVLYDIIVGNKSIRKDKDGKIIISNKSKYKVKIEELNSKVKKYEEELLKMKRKKKSDSDRSSSESSDSLSEKSSIISDISNDCEDEYYLDDKNI